MSIVLGFMYGVVSDNKDPARMGRVRVKIPGLWGGAESYHWMKPCGWPGSGHPRYGSRYPVMQNAQVCVMFEHGNTDDGGVYIPTMYGKTSDVTGGVDTHGPSVVLGQDRTKGFGLPLTPKQATERVCFWEDSVFSVYLTMHDDDRRFVILHKRSKSYIMVNATDGLEKKAVSVAISGQTAVVIKSQGKIELQGEAVYIQGRSVNRSGGPI